MTVHIIGAGLAGLACALDAADAGHQIVLHEAAGQAGGRCRSWFDAKLGREIDNGTHMVVGANHAVFDFLRRIGAQDSISPGPSAFPMFDLIDRTIWLATPARLIGSILASTWRLRSKRDGTIRAALGGSRLYHRFWDPLALGVMNTPADQASSRVFRRVVARTLWRGAKASQPFLARKGLSDSFVTPALTRLRDKGVTIRLNHRLRHIDRDGDRVTAIHFDNETITLLPEDRLVIAVSWEVARDLIAEFPELPTSPIVNAHFRVEQPPKLAGGLIGLLGGIGQWLFVKEDIISVTVSGADGIIDWDSEKIAEAIWQEVTLALGRKDRPLAQRIIKEKRATLFHTPAVEALRPPPRHGRNLILAGDWTATGLPCTLEGALTSGRIAARLL